MRLIIAAVLAGLAMFAWSAVSHMALGLVDSSMKQVPNEAAVMSAMKTNIAEPGFYLLPNMDMTHKGTEAEQAAWAAKYKEGPTAIIIYNPTGDDPISPRQLGVELVSNIAAALVVGMILMLASQNELLGSLVWTQNRPTSSQDTNRSPPALPNRNTSENSAHRARRNQ